ncbi:alpha/beta fold hydrolase [Edwardsiella hoshinae]|uniref:Homoserine O-acetyltransferase n=1 Tax=Edwardsiella hoshinae TaxID=93378 RepID=A0A376DJ11_9GAMM|nr:alpha/beta fold hydrolase [Edwardsiella hoshinae]QPR29621.1 alpha/beta fold hydrolase [Edwardsiella hoshinae]STC89925.1 Homoserine O-acetyltransferase [Edwardsiella hoshinae]
MRSTFRLFFLLLALISGAQAHSPRHGDWIARDFSFHDGTRMDLTLHYRTLGDPGGMPVLLLHGTAGSGDSFMAPDFAEAMFGPGQPLDIQRYFIIMPDAIGHGRSSKPSDGLRARFPRYNYLDMVAAQFRLVREGLGLSHLRLVMGNSMGGMHAWLWAERYPDAMDALIPMAAQPTEMASRNWILRRLITDSIRRDPAWQNGNYRQQPPSAHFASVFYAIATSGGNLAWQRQAPTWDSAQRLLEQRLSAPFNVDANDLLYQWDASRGYRADAHLEQVRAAVLAINAADDERNPPETGIMQRAIARLPHGTLYLIPAGPQSRGHATTAQAHLYAPQVARFLLSVPSRRHHAAA